MRTKRKHWCGLQVAEAGGEGQKERRVAEAQGWALAMCASWHLYSQQCDVLPWIPQPVATESELIRHKPPTLQSVEFGSFRARHCVLPEEVETALGAGPPGCKQGVHLLSKKDLAVLPCCSPD